MHIILSFGELKDNIGSEDDDDRAPYVNEERLDSMGYPLYTARQDRVNKEAHVYFRPSSLPGTYI